ncbi:MAG: ABC transporter ATP-binding protein [Treponema sp.]|nr:ABC transporter ATP-binding protein [Treponema sp.]
MSDSREILLDIKDLEIAYQTDFEHVKAVNGISFSLKKGTTLGIVGETGAGKTTTALSILRLLPDRTARVAGGSILFDNKDLMQASENEMLRIRGKRISMIFQDPMTSLNPIVQVGDQILEALSLHNTENLSTAELGKRVDQALELVGIQKNRKKDFPHQFSGGMKQRVVIAIAMACEPELLIADEPTTALDVTIQAQVLGMMNELKVKLNTSMILITHDLGIVAQTCDDVCVMYAGEIVEIGTADHIFNTKDHHPYTTGLFGSIPNLKIDTPRLNPIAGLMPDPTNLPKGCKFSPRCPKCMDICKEKKPDYYSDGEHKIMCHLYTR